MRKQRICSYVCVLRKNNVSIIQKIKSFSHKNVTVNQEIRYMRHFFLNNCKDMGIKMFTDDEGVFYYLFAVIISFFEKSVVTSFSHETAAWTRSIGI